jgi:hypothetical protein
MTTVSETNGATNGSAVRRGIKSERLAREIGDHISKDSLGLGPLVDLKRKKYGIPDEAFFNQCPAFNKILVAQIPEEESETYGGETGLIIKTEVAKTRELVEAPRGVIVGAGLQALDVLRSNGMDIGHTVGFTRLAPFRRPFATIGGEKLTLIVLVAGDIVDSEDLGQQLRARKVRVVAKQNEEGVRIHQYIDERGQLWSPVEADVPEDA